MASLLFDLYGVLMRPAGNSELEDYLRPENVEHFWSIYEEFRPAYNAGHLSDAQYWGRIRALTELSSFDVSHATELDTERLLVADEEMVRAVLGFIAQGHSVGILANVPTVLGNSDPPDAALAEGMRCRDAELRYWGSQAGSGGLPRGRGCPRRAGQGHALFR